MCLVSLWADGFFTVSVAKWWVMMHCAPKPAATLHCMTLLVRAVMRKELQRSRLVLSKALTLPPLLCACRWC